MWTSRRIALQREFACAVFLRGRIRRGAEPPFELGEAPLRVLRRARREQGEEAAD